MSHEVSIMCSIYNLCIVHLMKNDGVKIGMSEAKESETYWINASSGVQLELSTFQLLNTCPRD